ncbi:hypothetical protein JOC85_003241 [Bacillus mesophilus]|uniref:DUF2529 domain-containing protein n=1 Tax=Bacillus mesophilus TaxID=1808955 RepID=A0A6M0QB19_9BACI|nr:DUF2529 domain-containing protein [Bacillus mesophilus]MBM7662434.1 hypothetical protein [Bacillus mesophilus]NEY72939.1 DUF2529 domain-containing protein [Bacillus mesophilus]
MLKIFSTQLQGIFKKIEEKEDLQLEEGARLLSQALVGDGSIYLYGIDELQAVELTAMNGPEKVAGFLPYIENGITATIQPFDRVLIFSPYSNDPKALETVKALRDQNIPTVVVSSIVDKEDAELQNIADVHINTYLTKGLIPDDDGNRYGLPTTMVALYAYYGLMFTIKEILAEYADEE